MKGFGKPIRLHTLLAIMLILLAAFPATGGDCQKAVDLYNQSVDEADLCAKETLLKEAASLCSDPQILSRIYNNLADAYEKRQALSLALAFYKKALEASPDLATAWLSVGDIFFQLQDYYSAALMYEKARKYGLEDEEAQRTREESHEKARTHLVVYFDLDDATLPDRYLQRLEVLAQAVEEMDYPVEIRITGHTCDLGSPAYNQRLSLRRAQAVGRYLTNRLDPKMTSLVIEGKGQDRPLIAGHNSHARELARRAEIRVAYKDLRLSP
jgi:outer membrane protein OmpA-like peptidoglycan-associated protein